VTEPNVVGVSRSVLFAPGNHVRRVEKALQSDADIVVLDLEDAVPVTEKSSARSIVAEALKRPRHGRAYVRINALSSGAWEPDVTAVVSPALDGVVLPKAEYAADLLHLDTHLAGIESRVGLSVGKFDLMPIIDSARGAWNCEALAAATPCVRRLIFGAADYTLDLDLEWIPEEHEMAFARARLAHASRIANIEPPIDTAILQIRDAQRFLMSARNGRRMGFQGKLCLHPDQVAPCNALFSPSQAEIERARAVAAAFEAAQMRGTAAIELNGVLIDLPVVLKAKRLLALAARCAPQSFG
jgi:citrate lyase subunit beta/citryl-CoA lyase